MRGIKLAAVLLPGLLAWSSLHADPVSLSVVPSTQAATVGETRQMWCLGPFLRAFGSKNGGPEANVPGNSRRPCATQR